MSRILPMRMWLSLAVMTVGFSASARAEIATETEARRVCKNWLTYIVHHEGAWVEQMAPTIAAETDLVGKHGLLARCYSISPRGYVVVPVLKELPPIKAHSQESVFDAESTDGFPHLLREVLDHRLALYRRTYGSLDASQPLTGGVLFARKNRSAWDVLAGAPVDFQSMSSAPIREGRGIVGPLLETAWNQIPPYNNFCPQVDGDPTYVGCVITAAAQILRYYQWPPAGVGSHTYQWGGMSICGEQFDEWLSADFSDPYDWENMPAQCTTGSPQIQQDAVAELCYEVGAAFEANFGTCGTAAHPNSALSALPNFFRYDPAIDRESRNEHTVDSWFEVIQTELNAGRVMLYGLSGHAVVCDGWRIDGQLRQYHMNYGWGGAHSAWYVIDELYCTSPWGCDPLLELLIRNIIPDPDCNDNGIPDDQDILDGTSEDCNANSRPDECDLSLEVNRDCNENGVLDVCDITEETSSDCNANGWPDECDGVGYGDFDAFGGINLLDFQAFAACAAGPFAPVDVPDADCAWMYVEAFDFDFDGDVDLTDFDRFSHVYGISGPVADILLYWDFHEGDARDRSDHGYHGLVHGAMPLGSSLGGWSLWFDGIDDYVELLDTTDFAFANESFTLAALVAIVDNPDAFRFIIDISDTDMAPGVRIAKLPSGLNDGRFCAELCAASGECTQVLGIDDGATLVTMSGYVLVVLVADWDARELVFYMDGVEQSRLPLIDFDLSEASDLKVRVGCSAADSGYHAGGIDDVRIYRRALWKWDVQRLFDALP